MIIAITGTPGTGKTTLAKKLGEKLSYPVLDVTSFIAEKKLSSGYDKKRDCEIIDAKKLALAIKKEVSAVKREHAITGCIIDSHLSHYLPFIDYCIVTRCSLTELKKRLTKRKYSKEKIRENLDSEIFHICEEEAKEHGCPLFVFDTSQGIKRGAFSRLVDELKPTS